MNKNFRIILNFLLFAGFALILAISCKKSEDVNDQTVKDIDGNIYTTVTIGSQVWMVENLKTTKYRNGEPIPNVTDSALWTNLTTGAYCFYENDKSNGKAYGNLYNWYALIDSRNIAPIGWHIPSETELRTLKEYIGVFTNGGKLKEAGTTYWSSPNEGATNETGFTALPGGFRGDNGTFYNIKTNCYIWSTSTPIVNWLAIYLTLAYDVPDVYMPLFTTKGGLSVRCIKD